MLRETWDRHGNLISSEEETPPDVLLYTIEIVALFTPAELLAIEQATNLGLVVFRTQFFAALNPIALTDPRFLGAVGIMEQLGILSAERATAVRENRKP